MSSVSDNNKRIAKNTLLLYCRTFLTMIVGLYTGRVMLQALGVEDYGINAVVGGIVSMSALLTSTMSQAISRYITYALGKNDMEHLKTMFSTSVNAQIMMALLAAVALEIAGIWFLNTEANIPDNRLDAANWVLHLSIITLMITLVSTPFNALIIAHERMAVYAYMSILEVTLKLGICFAIMVYGGDRLILLASLHILVALLMNAYYAWYCSRNFSEARYSVKVFNKGLMKELTIFSGWSMLDSGAYIFATQGLNMLVNVFFGVVFNAARSVAHTVNGAIQVFVNNFTVAFTPQITKSYAAGDKTYSIHLVNRATRYTWLMMFLFIVPVFVEADMILYLWLGEVPDYAALLLRFALFESLAVGISHNHFKLIQADGHMKKYVIQASIVMSMIFFGTWLVYYFGLPVWAADVIFIIDFMFIAFIRCYNLRRLMNFSTRQYIKDCIVPCSLVSVVSFIIPLVVFYSVEPSVGRFLFNIPLSFLWTFACCLAFGTTKQERSFILEKVRLVLQHI